MINLSPRMKAGIITAAFGSVAAIFAIFGYSPQSLPLIVFYAILLINTYFSVRCFSSLGHIHDFLHHSVDTALAVLYVALASQFGNPLWFTATATVLFAMATTKYIILLPQKNHTKLLMRKIATDNSGILLCLLAFIGILTGRVNAAVNGLVIVFLAANIYVFFIHPLYRLPGKTDSAAK